MLLLFFEAHGLFLMVFIIWGKKATKDLSRRRCFCTTIVLLVLLSMVHHESTLVVEVMEEVLSNSHCGTLLLIALECRTYLDCLWPCLWFEAQVIQGVPLPFLTL